MMFNGVFSGNIYRKHQGVCLQDPIPGEDPIPSLTMVRRSNIRGEWIIYMPMNMAS